MYQEKTLYKLFKQKFYQELTQNTKISQKYTTQKPRTSYLNNGSTRMNIEQKFELEMYQEKPTTSYLNKNSTRMNLKQKFELEMYQEKTQYK